MSDQLDLFGGPPPKVDAAPVSERTRTLAARLPVDLRLGTSSWSFPGWRGLVYDRNTSEAVLAREGLRPYAAHPFFRTVGVDRTYYGPMTEAQLRVYANAVPDDFRFLVKAHVECTMTRFSRHPRWGDRRGTANERFLDPGYAIEEVVGPTVAGLGHKLGVLLFQFPPQSYTPVGGHKGFPARLHRFLSALPPLPPEAVVAIEVRNPELITTRYGQAIADVGVTHCLNALPGMQNLRVQWGMSGGAQRPALVVRWMLHRSHAYEEAKQTYAPFDRIVDDDPTTRGQIVDVLRDSPVRKYVVVNNKAEGSSPESVRKLVEALVGLEEDAPDAPSG